MLCGANTSAGDGGFRAGRACTFTQVLPAITLLLSSAFSFIFSCMKQFSALIIASALGLASLPATAQKAPSPYRTRFAVDGSVIAGELAVSGFGLYRSMQRSGLNLSLIHI